MKLLFIYPDIYPGHHRYFQQGIAWISSVLKEAGHETSLLHLTKEISKTKLMANINKFNPDIVAFSSTTLQHHFVELYAQWIKEELDIPIICGGIHASLAPSEVISASGIDFVCVGEGEYPLLELLNNLESGKSIKEIQNLWIKHGSRIIKNEVRPLISDLNSLPFPDRELYDYKNLLKENGYTAEFLAGRGCPFDCTYCCNHALKRIYKGKGKYVRMRSVDNVLDEIREVTEKYKVKNLWFYDDIFILFPKWIKEFSQKYRKEFDIPFACNGRVETLRGDILADLERAGCTTIAIGVEVGNEYFRNSVLKRRITNEQIVNGFTMAKKEGLEANAFYMLGLPFETPEMIEETLSLNSELNPDNFQFSVFYPFPNTELYEVCKANGFLTGKHKSSYFDEGTTLNLPTLGQEYLKYYYKKFKNIRDKTFNKRIKNRYPKIYPFYMVIQSILGTEKAYNFFRYFHTKLFV